MTTITTLFSGGELVGEGARAAGLTHLEGFEIKDDIAGVARANGYNVYTANILDVDPTTLQVPDLLHASTICKRASGANQSVELNEDGTKEAPEDIALGEKTAQFIDVMQPRYFTLENVYAYRNFKAFKIICAALSRGGYMWDYDNLNAADYGVPQTRRRLILRAVRGALLPNLPPPVKWVGWYEAIEDLIPELPESRFADWQLERLPTELRTFLINGNGNTNFAEAYPGRGCLEPSEPSHTVVTISKEGGAFPRAFIVTNGKFDTGLVMADEAAPVFTACARSVGVTANSNQTGVRAWLVDGQNSRTEEKGGLSVYKDDCPAMTVNSAMHGMARAWLSAGRVVSMTPRALARFQSVPDSYLLPDNKRLACTVIGNGVPCKLYEAIVRGLTQ